jgi:esterase/lipase superfamily enzyme
VENSQFVAVIFGTWLLTICMAAAQTDTNVTLPEPCTASTGATLEELEKQKLSLEQAVVTSRLQTDTLAATPNADPGTLTRAQQYLTRNQVSLIDVLYQIECFRSDVQRPAEVLRGSPASLTMTLFYATNRRPVDSPQPVSFYGTDDTRALSYGTTSISIPSSHKPGELELPSLWKLEWSPNPHRHFVVRSVTPLNTTDAHAQIAASLGAARSKSLLIFVHGYNVSFLEASYRTAQLAYDLRFPGLAMFYSWPSAGRTAGYLHDEESAQLGRIIFNQMLDELLALQFENVYIVAHSMGNRVVGGAIANRVQEGKDVSKFREILLAAPDINVEIFKSEIAPKLAGITTARKTIYASSSDVALKASSVVHGFPRVGDTKAGVFVHSGFDTIDASNAAPLMRSFGHSYVLDSSVVLNDLEDVIVWRRPVSERILRRLGVQPNLYWGLR